MTQKILLILLAFAVLAGCASNRSFDNARAMIESGNEPQGLERLEQAVKADPQNAELRNYYERHRAVAVQRYLQYGDNARASGAFDQAEAAYQQALRFDTDSARAHAGLEALEKARGSREAVAEAQAALKRGERDAAYDQARRILERDPSQREARAIVRSIEEVRLKAERTPPQLAAALDNRITIELRDAPVRSVFELLSKRSGLNFVYDRDIPPDLTTTVFVKDATIEQVIRYVLVTSGLERRVLNPNTLLVYPNTPQKAQAYQELVVKSFYLGNAEAKQTANMLRSVVKTRDMYVDEKLNLVVIRDTPEAVRMAEKLVASQDLAEPEVMLEVEVLEVSHNDLTQLGIQWPGQVALGLTGAAGVPGQITGREAQNLNGNLVRLTVSDPLISLHMRQQAGRSNLLANPRIRVKNKEKARIHIGDRVPVITTTAGATGFVSESVNYLDVGLKLEVEPNVHLEGEVGIKVGLEVSNISTEVKSAGGTVAYQVGTRNAVTSLRLRDGETQVLAGLISDEDRRSATKVPGLSRLPVLGRLFSNNTDNTSKTEVVLLITPRILRNIERPGAAVEEFNSGTELEVGRGIDGASTPPMLTVPGPGPGAAPEAPPAGGAPSAPGSLPPAPPGIRAPAAGPQPGQR